MYITRWWCAWDIRGNFLKVAPIESRDYATWKFAINPYESRGFYGISSLARAIDEIACRSTSAYVFDRRIAFACNLRDLYDVALVRNRVWVNKSWLLGCRQGNPVLWDENVPQASSLSLSKQLWRRRKIAKSSRTTIIHFGDSITYCIPCILIYIFLSIYFLLKYSIGQWKIFYWTPFHNFVTLSIKYRALWSR